MSLAKIGEKKSLGYTYRPPPLDGSPPQTSKKPFPSGGGFGRDEPPVPGEETSQDLTKMAATVHSDARSTPPAIHSQIPSQVGLRLILFSNTKNGNLWKAVVTLMSCLH